MGLGLRLVLGLVGVRVRVRVRVRPDPNPNPKQHAAHEGAVQAEVSEVLARVGRTHLVLLPHMYMCICEP